MRGLVEYSYSVGWVSGGEERGTTMWLLQQKIDGEWVTIKTCDSQFVASLWCSEGDWWRTDRRYVKA